MVDPPNHAVTQQTNRQGGMTSEASIQASIRKAVGLFPDVRLFRNNRGVAWMGKVLDRKGSTVVLTNARPVEFGLTNGASDLIGLRQITVTPDMVGRTFAVFVAAEVKRPGAPVPAHQQQFVDFVQRFGGLSGVVRDTDDAIALLRTVPCSSMPSPAAAARTTSLPCAPAATRKWQASSISTSPAESP